MKRLLIFLFVMIIGTSYADTETMNWYADGNLHDTTTCESGGNVSFPTNPTRTGHTFLGWGSFQALNMATNGTAIANNSQNRTWNVTFSYGTVYGESFCSNRVSATNSYETLYGNLSLRTPGAQNDAYDLYCWCKVIGFQPADVAYIPISTLPWTFDKILSANCSKLCSNQCATDFKTNATMRRNAYAVTQ